MAEEKKMYSIWLTPETNDLVTSLYKIDNCSTKSIFVERAVRFYAGYVTANKSTDYLATAVNDSVKRTLGSFENRMAKMLFKYSVEQAMMMNVLASIHKVEQPQLDILRGQCIEEIKRTRGQFSFSDAMKVQHGGSDEPTDS